MLDSKSLSYASHDNVEATSSRWLSPQDALVAHESKEIMLMPPTWYTLNELKSFSNVLELNRRAFEKKDPILPLFTNDDEGRFMLAMPGDVFHQDTVNQTGQGKPLIGTKHRLYLSPRESGGFDYEPHIPAELTALSKL